jgi:hypothetical protein
LFAAYDLNLTYCTVKAVHTVKQIMNIQQFPQFDKKVEKRMLIKHGDRRVARVVLLIGA